MKNSALLLVLGLAGPVAHAQQPTAKFVSLAPAPAGYQDLMAGAINELFAAHTPVTTKVALGKLARASATSPADWLPLYYQGLGYVRLGFLAKEGDEKDKNLDQAQLLVDQALKLARNPGEVLVLQAYIYQARLAVSPMLRAMEYGPKVAETLKAAQHVDPQNPRASYLMGSSLLYKPAMFGGGSEAAKPWLEKAVALYTAARPATPIAPHWGQSEAMEMLAQINYKK